MTATIVAPDTRTANRYQIRLLVILLLSFGCVFFDRQALSSLAPYMDEHFGLSDAEPGTLSAGCALLVVALCLALKETAPAPLARPRRRERPGRAKEGGAA